MNELGPIDSFLVRALRDDGALPTEMDPGLIEERVAYHGIAGLLIGPVTKNWPQALCVKLHQQALAQTMWDLRHKVILIELLDALTKEGVRVVLLKGTAMAYRYYENPAMRARGDSDLLIMPADVDMARKVLRENDFSSFYDIDADPTERKQEPWSKYLPDESRHEIDLHWSALNRPILDAVMPVETALSKAIALPALGRGAFMLPLHLALLHACLHRAKHVTSPYFVNGTTHYGGDRLIWLKDIDLMLRALDPAETDAFENVVRKGGVGNICAEAFQSAHELLATPLPRGLIDRLRLMPVGAAGDYLSEKHQVRRAAQDFRSMQGFRAKLNYLRQRLFPPADFMRTKYPELAHRPVLQLYMRRFIDFSRRRSGKTQ